MCQKIKKILKQVSIQILKTKVSIHKTQTKDVKHVEECVHHRLSSNLKPLPYVLSHTTMTPILKNCKV